MTDDTKLKVTSIISILSFVAVILIVIFIPVSWFWVVVVWVLIFATFVFGGMAADIPSKENDGT